MSERIAGRGRPRRGAARPATAGGAPAVVVGLVLLSAACATAPAGSPPTPPPPDPSNASYTVGCDGRIEPPAAVDVRQGTGRVDGADGRSFAVQVAASAQGSLVAPGSTDTAVLLSCTPAAGNFSVPVVAVLAGDGRVVELPMLNPVAGGYPIPVYEPREFSIVDGRLLTGVQEYAADESHADQPSLHYMFAWRWDGAAFVSEQVQGPAAEASGTMDVESFALAVARRQGIGPETTTASCPEPTNRPDGATVLCELRAPQTDPAFVAVRVTDASRGEADGVVIAGDVSCNQLPDWAFALKDQTDDFLCGE